MTVEWWGPVRDDAPDAPLHRMLDVPDDVLRRSACTQEVGTGYAKSASMWSPGTRCEACLRMQGERDG